MSLLEAWNTQVCSVTDVDGEMISHTDVILNFEYNVELFNIFHRVHLPAMNVVDLLLNIYKILPCFHLSTNFEIQQALNFSS